MADYFSDDKIQGLNTLKSMNLPRPFGQVVPARSYICNPDLYFDAVQTEKVFVNLIPSKPDLKKYSRFDIGKDTARQFIERTLPIEAVDDYSIGVFEDYPDLFAGNIVVSQKGNVFIEFGEGDHLNYARGNRIPQFSATQDRFTGIMQYDFTDKALREATWHTLSHVPFEQDGMRRTYTPGYYEFVLFADPKTGKLAAHFLDYKANPAYQFD